MYIHSPSRSQDAPPPHTPAQVWRLLGACDIILFPGSEPLDQWSPAAAAAAAKLLQSCQTLCDPIDGSPPGSAVPGILQARTLEWVAISFSNA